MAAIADRYAAQIPTDGYPSVASDNPVDSTEVGRNVSNALMAVPGAGPAMMAFRGLAGASKAAPVASNLISSVARAGAPAAPFIPPVAGGAGIILGSSPAAQTNSPPTPAASSVVAPAVQQPAVGQPGAAASSATVAPTVTPGVITRRGNSYSGTDVTGSGPIVNARNPDAGVTVLPAGSGGSPILDRALSDARRAAAARGDFDAVNASFAGGQAAGVTDSQLMAAANAPLGTPGKGFARQMLRDRMQDATQRRGQDINAAQIAGSNIIAGKRLELETNAANLDAAGKKRLQAAQDAYINAKTEAERETARETIRGLTGKNDLPARYTVVPQGQVADEKGLLVAQPALVLDNQTGTIVDTGATKPAALPPGLVVGAPSKQADGTYKAGNKTVTIKSGKVTEIR